MLYLGHVFILSWISWWMWELKSLENLGRKYIEMLLLYHMLFHLLFNLLNPNFFWVVFVKFLETTLLIIAWIVCQKCTKIFWKVLVCIVKVQVHTMPLNHSTVWGTALDFSYIKKSFSQKHDACFLSTPYILTLMHTEDFLLKDIKLSSFLIRL